ncbi:MAG: gamma carbonic anhydrase family protein [Rikenellaceae bacterium]|nr:gamma carbonic anhydrase family protein [Rikenellaceae bacterium]
MAIIRALNGITPKVGEHSFLAETAVLVGDVVIGKHCSIWYNAVLRGDVNPIILGNNVNIQDGAVLHTLYKKSIVRIGNNVSVGHNANIHGATVEDDCLIGMGATLLDDVVVGKGAIVAANSLVRANTRIESYTVWAGVPAVKVKELGPEQREMGLKNAQGYLLYKSWYQEPSE